MKISPIRQTSIRIFLGLLASLFTLSASAYDAYVVDERFGKDQIVSLNIEEGVFTDSLALSTASGLTIQMGDYYNSVWEREDGGDGLTRVQRIVSQFRVRNRSLNIEKCARIPLATAPECSGREMTMHDRNRRLEGYRCRGISIDGGRIPYAHATWTSDLRARVNVAAQPEANLASTVADRPVMQRVRVRCIRSSGIYR